MTDIILFLVILALSGLIGWMEFNNRKERAKFLNALISKNNEDMVQLELADKTKIEAVKKEKPDLIPLEDVSDEEFMETIVNK